MFRIFKELKRKLVNWAYSEDDKFIEELYFDDYQVLTPNGYKPFKGIGKTIKFQEYKVILETGKELICADKHIFRNEYSQNIWTTDIIPNETKIQTKDGLEVIISVEKLKTSSNMYDLLDVEDGLYMTNDIVSHNSTVFAIYVLHFLIFNKDKNIALLANKARQSVEILARIKIAYQTLPKWLQQGIVVFNNGEVKLENGSRVTANATSSDAIRGETISLLIIDECLVGNSLLTVRDKQTQEIKQISIKDLYNEL